MCRLVQYEAHAIPILDIGGMDGDAQQQTERVEEDMPLATDDFSRQRSALRRLGRVIILGVEKSPLLAPLWRFGCR